MSGMALGFKTVFEKGTKKPWVRMDDKGKPCGRFMTKAEAAGQVDASGKMSGKDDEPSIRAAGRQPKK